MRSSVTKILFLLLIGHSHSALSQQSYQVTGTAPASLEDKIIYLSTIDYSGLKQQTKDSTRIQNGRFAFAGQLQQTAMLTTLYIPQPTLGIYQFFLENRSISIDIHPVGRFNTLDSITIGNSPVTVQYLALKKKLKQTDSLITRQMAKMDTSFQQANGAAKGQMQEELNRLMSLLKKGTIGYIKENPSSYLSLFELCYAVPGSSINEADSLDLLLSHLSPNLQQMPEAQRLLSRIQQSKAVRKGQPAPWIATLSDKDIPFSLQAYNGKYILLDFWASWCGPCIQGIPALKAFYNNFHAQGGEAVSISLDDDKSKWLGAIKKHDLPWTQVSDLKGWNSSLGRLYDIRAIPQFVLIAPDGTIISSGTDLKPIQEALTQHAATQTSASK